MHPAYTSRLEKDLQITASSNILAATVRACLPLNAYLARFVLLTIVQAVLLL
jgi:hypothetical protein